jgi:DNA-directed RNA polymerase specialized sigma subunit
MQHTFVNAQFADADTAAWQEYKRNPTSVNRSKLLKRFDGLINAQVNKWSGPVARDVLMNEARLLAVKAFDNFNPASGASLATYLTNQLLPLSRVVYTYQNAARMPENITQKINTFNTANDMLKITLGREPTTDELHSELGWSASDITRIRDYNRRDLIESGPAVSGDFYAVNKDDEDDMLLGAIYFELSPEEKRLFEYTTGYNGAKVLSNPELTKKLGITQAQLSYRKVQLRNRIEQLLSKQSRIG